MNIIEEVCSRLSKYPDARVQSGSGIVTVKPESASGFPVSLEITKSGYRVSFDGWHEDLNEAAGAADATRGLNHGVPPSCRFVSLKGGSHDESTKANAGRTPASKLFFRNHSCIPVCR